MRIDVGPLVTELHVPAEVSKTSLCKAKAELDELHCIPNSPQVLKMSITHSEDNVSQEFVISASI